MTLKRSIVPWPSKKDKREPLLAAKLTEDMKVGLRRKYGLVSIPDAVLAKLTPEHRAIASDMLMTLDGYPVIFYGEVDDCHLNKITAEWIGQKMMRRELPLTRTRFLSRILDLCRRHVRG